MLKTDKQDTLTELQQLAAKSIGIKGLIRQRSLVLERHQLIKEL